MAGEIISDLDKTKSEVFSLVQQFLKLCPVIIWGSGATIPYGLPSMNDLRKKLGSKIGEIDEKADFETELGRVADSKLDEIKRIIRDEVFKKNQACLNNLIRDSNYFESIVKMIKTFYDSHPRKVDIVTTNYDCVLEYALSKSNYNFADGFTGRAFSRFNREAFEEKEMVNLLKVHGSLNWFSDENNNVFYLPSEPNSDTLKYSMVLPASNKYREAYEEPYRTLITKSDSVIETANSFFVVGFGFNDLHLTPKIDDKIKAGTPIVIITKKATKSCKEKLNKAGNYCLFEEIAKETKVTFKRKKDEGEQTLTLEGNYWELGKFMEVL